MGVRGGIQLILVNNCAESIWPGLLGTAGHPTPQSGGFRQLARGDHERGCAPQGLRTAAGVLRYDGHPRGLGTTSATVAEMTLYTLKFLLHFYHVSLVDGFKAPVSMAPVVSPGIWVRKCLSPRAAALTRHPRPVPFSTELQHAREADIHTTVELQRVDRSLLSNFTQGDTKPTVAVSARSCRRAAMGGATERIPNSIGGNVASGHWSPLTYHTMSCLERSLQAYQLFFEQPQPLIQQFKWKNIPTGNQLQTLALDDPTSMYVGNFGLCGPPLPNGCRGNMEHIILQLSLNSIRTKG